MIHLHLDELVHAVRLKSPDISIYVGNLIKCSTVYDHFPSGRHVWK